MACMIDHLRTHMTKAAGLSSGKLQAVPASRSHVINVEVVSRVGCALVAGSR